MSTCVVTGPLQTSPSLSKILERTSTLGKHESHAQTQALRSSVFEPSTSRRLCGTTLASGASSPPPSFLSRPPRFWVLGTVSPHPNVPISTITLPVPPSASAFLKYFSRNCSKCLSSMVLSLLLSSRCFVQTMTLFWMPSNVIWKGTWAPDHSSRKMCRPVFTVPRELSRPSWSLPQSRPLLMPLRGRQEVPIFSAHSGG